MFVNLEHIYITGYYAWKVQAFKKTLGNKIWELY